MPDFIGYNNFEYTLLENEDFQFNCFNILNYDTFPHWHIHTEIIYVHKGTCPVYINGVLFLCQQGELLLVPSGSLHSISPETYTQYYALVIGDTLFTAMMSDLHCKNLLGPFLLSPTLSPLHLCTTHISYLKWMTSIQEIIREYSIKDSCFQVKIKIELCRFFVQLVSDFPEVIYAKKQEQPRYSQTLKKALEYISHHYHNKITIAEMSAFAHMSEQHFCRLFKAYTGKTLIEFITIYRLEHANNLLIKSDIPITQIPELTGFCNANYFARVYKKRYGYAPSHTRKRAISTIL